MALNPLNPMRRFFEIQVQQMMCQMMSSEFENVSGWELNPMISLLHIIKDHYALTKPEVYKTIIAILYDYNPSYGEKHREKTMHYLSLLLSSNAQLADCLLRLLPPAIHASVECNQSSNVAQSKTPKTSADNNDNQDASAMESVNTAPTATRATTTSSGGQMQTAAADNDASSSLGTVPSRSNLVWPIAGRTPVPSKPAAVTTSSPAQSFCGDSKTIEDNSSVVWNTQSSNRSAPSASETRSASATVTRSAFTVGKVESVKVAAKKPIRTAVATAVSAAPRRCLIAPACRASAGQSITPAHCLILRPVRVCSKVLPNTAPIQKAPVDATPKCNRIALGPTAHQILPKAIPRVTFAIPKSPSASRVIQFNSPSSSQHPLRNLIATSDPGKSSSVTSEQPREDSPLSCIQSLVENAGSGVAVWLKHLPGLEKESQDQIPLDEKTDHTGRQMSTESDTTSIHDPVKDLTNPDSSTNSAAMNLEKSSLNSPDFTSVMSTSAPSKDSQKTSAVIVNDQTESRSPQHLENTGQKRSSDGETVCAKRNKIADQEC